ncbi:MAG: class I SAM-dependent methyltransferase, partial [Promethearchaeota archaeon]
RMETASQILQNKFIIQPHRIGCFKMGKNRKEQKKKVYEFYVSHQRPEEFAKDPLLYYSSTRVKEYAESKSLMRIQEGITKRSLEILKATTPALILDIGMGCGFASIYLNLNGYRSVGIDLNRLFLNYYNLAEVNPTQADMRYIGMRSESVDYILSISAVQWLLAEENPQKREKELTLFAEFCAHVLKPQGKLLIQFYPKSDVAMDELGHIFNLTESFTGNFIIDNPYSPKKRRIFLFLEKK